MSAYSYEEICSLVGHLYITSQTNIKRLESEYQRLFLANQELSKQPTNIDKENDNGLLSKRQTD